jgi:serine/threonine protein kinase
VPNPPPSESGAPGETEEAADEFDALLRSVAAAPRMPRALLEAVTFEPSRGLGSLAKMALVPSVGDVVDGRYRILAELGRGGMGVVFAAHQMRTGRAVALKWLLPGSMARGERDRRESVERFVREARAVSRVDHPNVVRVWDVGGELDTPYLVMERLEGETLRARIARGPLGWDEAMELLLPALQGVEAAHRVGVLHRDLKPDNVFLSVGVTKILDFGVSRIYGEEDHTTLTRTGTMLGTPAYMPLEQLRGNRTLDARTDVYALGVIFFEALSGGSLPFEAQTPADQAVLLATESPRALEVLRPELAGARAAAVMRALGREPQDRYSSAEAMRTALLQASLAASTPARAHGGVLRGRRGWAVVLAALVVCAVLGALTARRLGSGGLSTHSAARAVTAKSPRSLERTELAAENKPAPVPATVPGANQLPAPVGVRQSRGTGQKPGRQVEQARVESPDAANAQSTRVRPTTLSSSDFQASESDGKEQSGAVPPQKRPARAKPTLERSEF